MTRRDIANYVVNVHVKTFVYIVETLAIAYSHVDIINVLKVPSARSGISHIAHQRFILRTQQY